MFWMFTPICRSLELQWLILNQISLWLRFIRSTLIRNQGSRLREFLTFRLFFQLTRSLLVNQRISTFRLILITKHIDFVGKSWTSLHFRSYRSLYLSGILHLNQWLLCSRPLMIRRRWCLRRRPGRWWEFWRGGWRCWRWDVRKRKGRTWRWNWDRLLERWTLSSVFLLRNLSICLIWLDCRRRYPQKWINWLDLDFVVCR